jgi:hypothetical protein
LNTSVGRIGGVNGVGCGFRIGALLSGRNTDRGARLGFATRGARMGLLLSLKNGCAIIRSR